MDVAETIDTSQREGKGITGQAQKRLPGVRNLLPEAVDVLGQPRQDFGPVQAMLDPTRATTARELENPLCAELMRLDAGFSGFRKKEDETDAEYRQRVQEFGRLYTTYGLPLISARQYRNATDELKRESLATLNHRAKLPLDEGREREAPGMLNAPTLLQSARESLRRRQERRQGNSPPIGSPIRRVTMCKLSKDIFIVVAFCLTLGIRVGYAIGDRVSAPAPTPTINPALLRRAEKEPSPDAIFKAVELKIKLRDRDAFMREYETLSREQLLERIEDLARIIGECEAELKNR